MPQFSIARLFVCVSGTGCKGAEEFYDTCQHEVKHAVEHISEYYKVDSRSEEAAYLQGEISRKMFPAVAMAVCPICHE